MLTDGDIVEYWLNSSSSDGSPDQECICQQAICANYGSMGNVAAATCTGELLNSIKVLDWISLRFIIYYVMSNS